MADVRKFLIFVIVPLLLIGIIYFSWTNSKYNTRIHNSAIEGKISWVTTVRGKYKMYYRTNQGTGLRIFLNEDINVGYDDFIYNTTFNIPKPLIKGDSISKVVGSTILKVFRKQNGAYQLYNTYSGN